MTTFRSFTNTTLILTLRILRLRPVLATSRDIAARISILALESYQGPLTREGVVDALEGLGQFDIGLGEPLYFSKTEHQASHRIWPTVLRDGRFVPFQWSDIKALSSSEAPP
jgi:hypothetical protein